MDIGGVISGILSAPLVCILWVIIGIVAGALARRIMGARNQPFWNDLVLGLIGALVGGFVARLFRLTAAESVLSLTGIVVNLIVATVGALILVAIGRALRGGRR